MNQLILLIDEFIMKAVTMTESILEDGFKDGPRLDHFTQNRERLLQVIDQISQQISWETVAIDTRQELHRKIEYIKNLDAKLLVKLQEFQDELKKDVEQTFKQKESIKGYNLSDVK